MARGRQSNLGVAPRPVRGSVGQAIGFFCLAGELPAVPSPNGSTGALQPAASSSRPMLLSGWLSQKKEDGAGSTSRSLVRAAAKISRIVSGDGHGRRMIVRGEPSAESARSRPGSGAFLCDTEAITRSRTVARHLFTTILPRLVTDISHCLDADPTPIARSIGRFCTIRDLLPQLGGPSGWAFGRPFCAHRRPPALGQSRVGASADPRTPLSSRRSSSRDLPGKRSRDVARL